MEKVTPIDSVYLTTAELRRATLESEPGQPIQLEVIVNPTDDQKMFLHSFPKATPVELSLILPEPKPQVPVEACEPDEEGCSLT